MDEHMENYEHEVNLFVLDHVFTNFSMRLRRALRFVVSCRVRMKP